MRNYEIMTIINPALGEDKAKAVSKSVQDLLTDLKGEIIKTDFWGKKKLAYEIKGNKEGYYDVIDFKIDAAGLAKFKSKIRLMEDLVRYLVSAKS